MENDQTTGLARLPDICHEVYGDRLVALVLFGSRARGTNRPDSDVDLLIVADPLPKGRMTRVAEFSPVEDRWRQADQASARPRLAPLFKTPGECFRGSPLFFDMVEDARLLYDRDGFFDGVLRDLRARLQRLGARRIWRGSQWYWHLKPDCQPGEVFEI